MTKPNSGKSAINKHMNKIQNTKDEPCYSDGRGQFGHSFYEGEDKCMYCGKSRTTTTDKPMNQIDKLKEEFDKEFGPKTIWVVPSKENIETIKDIWSWIIQNFTPKEEVKKIDMKNKTMNKSSEGKKEDIYKKLSSLGYKIDFWYEKGQIDAICIAQWSDKDLIWKKTYKVEDIARILFNDYLKENNL